MKKFIAVTIIVGGIVVIAAFSGLFSQEAGDTDKMMEVMMKYGTPGESHQKLNPLTGNWSFTTKWWADPSASPEESKGTCEAEWVLGGRFVQEKITGDMAGQPFHGMGFTGYDNYNQKYQMFWIDEMATCFLIADGHIDKDGKMITFEGTYDDYMSGQKGKPFKSEVLFVDANTRIYRSYEFPADGKPYVSFEVDYKRAM